MRYKTFNVISLTTVLLLFLTNPASTKKCSQIDLCSCSFEDGSKVDLTSLGNTDNTPRFKDVKGSLDGNIYSYNPCSPFKEGSCKDAAACVQDPTMTQSVQIGDASKAAIKYDEQSGNLVVGYTSGTIADLRLTQVIFVCEKSVTDPVFTAQGEEQGGEFQFTVKTVCACPNGCTASGPSNGGSSGNSSSISGGSILLIGFAVVIVLYLSIGIAVQKFVRKKEGKEIIPNSSLWCNLPSHLKAGAIFVLGLCIPRFRNKTFDAI